MANPVYADAVLLLGDSLTEPFEAGSFAQRVAEYYRRKLDVVNRGHGGYTTKWSLPILKRTLVTKSDREQGKGQKIRLMTIWLGTNDSVLPGEVQHVPLHTYRSNLAELIDTVASSQSEYYSPDTRIVVINAPPVMANHWQRHVNERRQEQGLPPTDVMNRSLEHTQKYTEACIEVATEKGVAVVDLWKALSTAAGGTDEDQLRPYLYDGLHFNPNAYEVLFNEFKRVVTQAYPELDAENMPMVAPKWDEIVGNEDILRG